MSFDYFHIIKLANENIDELLTNELDRIYPGAHHLKPETVHVEFSEPRSAH